MLYICVLYFMSNSTIYCSFWQFQWKPRYARIIRLSPVAGKGEIQTLHSVYIMFLHLNPKLKTLNHRSSQNMCLCCLTQLWFWKLARESKSLTRLSPPSSFLLRGDLPLPPSAWSFPSYLISNLRDVTPLVPAIDGIYSFSLSANDRLGF